jgi:hypothetical protein
VDGLDFDLLTADFVPDRLDGGAPKFAKRPLPKTQVNRPIEVKNWYAWLAFL